MRGSTEQSPKPGVKVAEALPGIIGTIISWILNRAADVVGWVWQNLCTGKSLRFPIYVYNMVFGCLFNVFQETRERNNFQFQDT